MTSLRKDIIERSSNINVRIIDKDVKNSWRWEWLEKQVNGIYLRECIRKLSLPGVAYCIICCKELYYRSRGSIALVDHVGSTTHKNQVKLRKDQYVLPGTGEGSSNVGLSISPYGLHPMYAVNSPIAEVTIPTPLVPLGDRICNNEAMLLSFLAEKSLPFSIAPDILELSKELSKDKKALDRMSMHRTAASYKLRFGVGLTFKDKLISDLKNTFFSLNVDETTSNNQKVVTILVNYLGAENKIVTKHLESFSTDIVDSKSLFEGIKNLFHKNELPFKNLMSILLDSCNVMRGKKAGLESKVREQCPHLLDIDGDSCHHAHNAAKKFCKPFSGYLENLSSDIHSDAKWSPDLRAALSIICDVLNIKYTMPQNFIPFRWLSIYDAAQDLSRLYDAYLLFYFSFLDSLDRTKFLHLVVKVFKQHEVSEEGKNKIRILQDSLQKKSMTEAGKNRKERIASKIIKCHLETKLNLSLFISVLPLLQEYVKLFQSNTPLIHLVHDKQISLLKNFLSCFIKPEVLLKVGHSSKKLNQLDVSEQKNHLPKKCIFVGETAKKLTELSSKSCSIVVKKFFQNTMKAYVECAKTLQTKMPIQNRFLKAVSSIDPWCRQHTLSLELMGELPNHVKNVLSPEENEKYNLEVRTYQVDCLRQPKEAEDIDTWWVEMKKTGKYPLLSKMVLALLTCFHGPKVESSFSIMNNVLTPQSSRMNIPTFDAIQTVKYELSAKNKSAIDLFKKNDFLKDAVDYKLVQNMKSASKRYTEEKLKNKLSKERKIKEHSKKKEKILSKLAAKKLCAKAAKKQFKRHIKINSKTSNGDSTNTDCVPLNEKRKESSENEVPSKKSKLNLKSTLAKEDSAEVNFMAEKCMQTSSARTENSYKLSGYENSQQKEDVRVEITSTTSTPTVIKQKVLNTKFRPSSKYNKKKPKAVSNKNTLTITEFFSKKS